MSEEDVIGIDDPEKYGIQDPEAPGEPDYFAHPPSAPVPGTAKQTRDEREGNRAGQHDLSDGAGHKGSSGGRGGHGGQH